MVNSSHNTTAVDDFPHYEQWEGIIIITVMLLLSVMATFGNVMVLLAYRRVKLLQRATNYFIISLAIADIIVATFVVNVHTMYMVIGWPFEVFGYDMCLLWLCVDYWVFQVSVFGILLVTGDRYLSIKYPIRYRIKRTDNRVKQAIVANWIISFLIWVPLIIIFGYNENASAEMKTRKLCDVGSAKVVPATIIGCCVSYLLPTIIVVILVIDSVRTLLNLKTISVDRKKSVSAAVVFTNPFTVPVSSSSEVRNSIRFNDIEDKDANFFNRSEVEGSNYKKSSELEMSTDIEDKNNAQKKKLRSFSVPTKQEMAKKSIRKYSLDPVNEQTRNACKRHSIAVNSTERVATKNVRRQSRRQSSANTVSDYKWMASFNILLGVSFVVNILPFGVLAITRSFCSDCVSQKMWYFGYIMCYLNSMLNPICYALGNKNFKQAFLIVLCGKNQRRLSAISMH